MNFSYILWGFCRRRAFMTTMAIMTMIMTIMMMMMMIRSALTISMHVTYCHRPVAFNGVQAWSETVGWTDIFLLQRNTVKNVSRDPRFWSSAWLSATCNGDRTQGWPRDQWCCWRPSVSYAAQLASPCADILYTTEFGYVYIYITHTHTYTHWANDKYDRQSWRVKWAACYS